MARNGMDNVKPYWMKPSYVRTAGVGGVVIAGPVQINWYKGLTLHTTWPVHRSFSMGD